MKNEKNTFLMQDGDLKWGGGGNGGGGTGRERKARLRYVYVRLCAGVRDLEGSAMRADRLTLRGAQCVFCRLKAGLETDKVMESPASGSYTDTVPISVSETVTSCLLTCLKQSHRAY